VPYYFLYYEIIQRFISLLPVCRDNLIGGAGTANGTLEPLANMNMGEQRSCSATISAPDGYQIQFSCSVVNMSSDSYLSVRGFKICLIKNFENNKLFSKFRSTEA
jgi:hypothetical protein